MNQPGSVNGAPSRMLESLPDDVVASIEVRDAWRKRATSGTDGLEFIISDLAKWPPGSTVRVAFLDGDADLHADIASATRQITESCNLTLDFGLNGATGEYRRWTEEDTAHAAEIRVSFDLGGYWSLVGTDSNDRSIGTQGGPIGGGPAQRSLNLGGFTTDRPTDWEGTVRHEFLHALAFHHAHQNMRGPCESEFRWEDDPGYVPTKDENGVFIPDPDGRAPGIYTYLAGPPNGWPRQKVDHNLRTEDDPATVVGPFDPDSVMLYRFEPFFYKRTPSPCAPTGNGVDISSGDKRGLHLLYPGIAAEVAVIAARANRALDAIGARQESDGGPMSEYQERVVRLLEARAAAGAARVPVGG